MRDGAAITDYYLWDIANRAADGIFDVVEHRPVNPNVALGNTHLELLRCGR